MTPAPACRLYLVTPLGIDPAALAAALDGGDVGCVLLQVGDADANAIVRAGKALLSVVHGHDVAMVLDGRPELAAQLGCDGVHLGAGEDYAAARGKLGDDRIVGVDCGTSCHLAIEAAEAGADYVAFGNSSPAIAHESAIDVVRWWSEMMTVPCVAAGARTVEECGALAGAGADFVAVGDAVWNHTAGPAAAIRELTAAIARQTAA